MRFGKKKDPAAEIEAELSGLRERREQLAARLTETKQDIEAALLDRRRALVEAVDDQPLSRRVDELRATAEALQDAILEVDRRIVAAEKDIANARGRAAVDAEVRTRQGHLAELSAASAEFAPAATRLAKALGALSAASPTAASAGAYINNLKNELKAAVESAVSEVQSYLAMLDAGNVAPRPQPESPPPPAPPPPRGPRKAVYLMVDGKWTEDDGKVCSRTRYNDVELPERIATVALQHGHAIEKTDERARGLRVTRGSDYSPIAPALCIDITLPRPKPLEVAKQPRAFTEVRPS